MDIKTLHYMTDRVKRATTIHEQIIKTERLRDFLLDVSADKVYPRFQFTYKAISSDISVREFLSDDENNLITKGVAKILADIALSKQFELDEI